MMQQSITKTDPLPDRINEIVQRVRQLRDEHGYLLRKAAAAAKEMGELLTEARKIIPRSQWRKWIVAELDLTPDTAARYIAIAAQWDRVARHGMFPAMTVMQMFDVARGREPSKRKYSMRDQSLDVLLDILDERLVGYADEDIPELQAVIEAIDNARPIMERLGLLNTMVERRKMLARQARRKADGSFAMEQP